MSDPTGAPTVSAARKHIMKRLETLIEERTAFGNAFDAYMKGSLTSTDCSTLVDVVLRQFLAEAGVSERHALLLEVVTDAVAQLANRESVTA